MVRSVGLILTLAVLASTGFGRVAWADELHSHGALVCHPKAGVALARFTTSYNDEPAVYMTLPRDVDAGLSRRDGVGRADCRLADGATVRLRLGREQAFAYGAGGGDPPNFFTLWIDGRKVLSKRIWRQGYEKSIERFPMLVGLAIRRDRLTYCYAAEGSKAASCHAEALNLVAHPVDMVEYATGPKAKVGTVLGPESREPALCRRYLDTVGLAFGGLVRGGDDPTPFAAPLTWSKTRPAGPGSERSVEIRPGPGAEPLRLTAFSGASHFFDGDIYVVTPRAVSPAEVTAFWMRDDDPESIPTRPRPDGWTVISGGAADLYREVSARYVHLRVQQIDGRLYVLAAPGNRKHRPAAVLLAITPEAEAAQACVFETVEPNF